MIRVLRLPLDSNTSKSSQFFSLTKGGNDRFDKACVNKNGGAFHPLSRAPLITRARYFLTRLVKQLRFDSSFYYLYRDFRNQMTFTGYVLIS